MNYQQIPSYILEILGGKEARILILGTLSGAAAQAICKEYLKKHPEFLDEQPLENKEVKPEVIPRKRRLRRVLPHLLRGGALTEIAGLSAIKLVKFLAANGLLAGFLK